MPATGSPITRVNVEEIFHAALQRENAAERQAFLDGACAGDAGLRERAEALLAAHQEASSFLEQPLVEPGTPLSEGPGTRIGRYKLLQLIGEGGMGAVYMAEQEEPVRRKVALKIIKLGMDTKAVIARFEAERQALALMDHPNIARVLDAGATETGRPYFVMELVRGIPIEEYCDQNNLTTRERLELFVPVCHAIQHAHQKGIIHRDIKPSNVLVTLHDGEPMPKVIDFGIAKATSQRLTEKTLFTEFRQFVGTPEYMSPEQAEMSGLDVDTRTDIYALGVLLYQLLTGTTPFDARRLRESGYGEIQRIIREEQPPNLSTRASKMGDALPTLAKRRGTDPRELVRGLRGDLDWIVMKAIEKDRTRRYDSPSELAADVRRHLRAEPVLAGPPSGLYRLQKFVTRHRTAVLGGLLTAVLLGVGLAVASVGFVRASREARRTRTINETLEELIAATDPLRAANIGVDVEHLLETSNEVFGPDHATSAALVNAMAIQLHRAGDLEAAEPLYRDALERWRALYGDRNLNVATALHGLGDVLRTRGDDEGAEACYREALSMLDELEGTPVLAGCDVRFSYAELLQRRGERQAAAEQIELAMAEMRDAEPMPRHRMLESFQKLVEAYYITDPEKVGPVVAEWYALANDFYPEDSPYLALVALARGNHLFDHGSIDEARRYLTEAYERYERLGDEAPAIMKLAASDRLFQTLRGSEDPERAALADEVLETCIELARPIWGDVQLLETLAYLAIRYTERGHPERALDPMIEAAALAQGGAVEPNLAGRIHERVAELAFEVAMDADRDEGVLTRALDKLRTSFGDEATTSMDRIARAAIAYRLGRLDEAQRLLVPVDERLDEDYRAEESALRCLVAAAAGRNDDAAAQLEAMRARRADLDGDNNDEHHIAFFAEAEAALAR